MNPDDLGTMISQDYFSTTVTDGITITTTDDCDTLTSTVTGSTITLDDYNWFENRNLRYGYSGAYMSISLYGPLKGTILNFIKFIYLFLQIILSVKELNVIRRSYIIKSKIYKILGIFKFYCGKKIIKYY